MDSTALIAAIRDALIDADLGLSGVFVAGSVEGRPLLPYATLQVLPSAHVRAGTTVRQVTDGVQVDLYAPTLSDALAAADAIYETVLGIGAVAVAGDGSPFGIEPASGAWRTVFPAEPQTSGERLFRVAQLFTQVEYRPT